jgi:hypothetical protein
MLSEISNARRIVKNYGFGAMLAMKKVDASFGCLAVVFRRAAECGLVTNRVRLSNLEKAEKTKFDQALRARGRTQPEGRRDQGNPSRSVQPLHCQDSGGNALRDTAQFYEREKHPALLAQSKAPEQGLGQLL